MNLSTENKTHLIEVFDGEIVHPSLDIKNGVLILGFRYRARADEEKDMFVVANGDTITTHTDLSFKAADRQYHIEKRNRKLMQIEERWNTPQLFQFLDDYANAKPLLSSEAVLDHVVSLGKKYMEAHLYFNAETGQYDCKKCGEKGNLITLAKHFGEGIQEIALNPVTPAHNSRKSTKFEAELVETCHLALPANIRQYLNARGISDAVIDAHKLGWGKFYGKSWITIPIQDIYGAFCFFKLRQDPNAR